MSPELTANRTVTADDVRNEAVELLEGLVDESVGGYRVNRTMLFDAILYAAAEGTSLHGACGMLDGLADDTTLRDHLNAAFPAEAARGLGMHQVPLLCGSEIAVPHAMPLCIRVLLHVNTDKQQHEMVHVYLREAKRLRPDMDSAQ